MAEDPAFWSTLLLITGWSDQQVEMPEKIKTLQIIDANLQGLQVGHLCYMLDTFIASSRQSAAKCCTLIILATKLRSQISP